MATRNDGHHLWNSFTQCWSMVAGQTIRIGLLFRRDELSSDARNEIIWMVFPRPYDGDL